MDGLVDRGLGVLDNLNSSDDQSVQYLLSHHFTSHRSHTNWDTKTLTNHPQGIHHQFA